MWNILEFDSLQSTNDYAKENYTNLKNGSVVWAKKQTKGRGRFKRVWESEEDLTFSILFSTAFPHAMLAPLCVVKTLEQFHIKSGIKWPNDILVNGKKVCGILIEQVYEGSFCAAQIVGIGINTSKKKEHLEYATWVNIPREELLAKLLHTYEQLLSFTHEQLFQMYQSYHILRGKKINLENTLWTILDITEEGYLKIQHDEEMRLLKSEEISLSHLYLESEVDGDYWCRL